MPDHLRLPVGVAAFVLVALVLAACASGTPAAPSASGFTTEADDATLASMPELDPDLVAQGEIIYRQNCAACHGARGEGQPNWKEKQADGTYPAPPHTVDGHTWHHGDGTLFQYVKEGGAGLDIPNFKSGMPGFAGQLTDEEIIAVLTYIKSLWPEEQQRTQFRATLQDPLTP